MNDDPELLQEQPLMQIPEYDMVTFDPDEGRWRNHFPVECQREFRPIASHHRGRGLIDAIGAALYRKGEAEWGRVPIEKPVAQVHGNALPGQLAPILQTRYAADVMGRKGGPQFRPEILDRHEFQLEFLADRPVVSATPGKSSGGLGLEFALADIADICADHEAEQMLGINALCVNTARKQRGETNEERLAGPRTNGHPQAMEMKRRE